MLMLVTYDVRTDDLAGRRRLRRVARACLDCGQRVQFSVFECEVDPARWVELRARLLAEIDPVKDSLGRVPLRGVGAVILGSVGCAIKLPQRQG